MQKPKAPVSFTRAEVEAKELGGVVGNDDGAGCLVDDGHSIRSCPMDYPWSSHED